MDILKVVYLCSNTEFFTALLYTNSFALTVYLYLLSGQGVNKLQ